MPYVIRYPAISAILPHPGVMQNLSVLFVLKLTIPAFLGTLLVIFALFVLANMMTRPELFPDMTPSGLLRMALTCLSRKRRNMFEKAGCLFKGLFTHLLSGCSICAGFVRHIAKTVVQILRGGDISAES